MTTQHLQRAAAAWEHMAQEDPLYAIMTDPEKAGGKWDEEEFFNTGVADVERHTQALLAALDEFDPVGEWRPRVALDFGCGVGRLTRGLAEVWTGDEALEQIYGLDISPAMIAAAEHMNPAWKIDFRLHTPPTLELDDASVDLVLSLITLQHLQT